MLPLLLAAGGAGLGLVKGYQNNKKNEADAKFRKAAITYSPWTGMQDPGRGPDRAGMFDSALSGAGSGLALSQGGMGGAGGLAGMMGGGEAAAAGGAAAAPAVAPQVAPYQALQMGKRNNWSGMATNQYGNVG